MSWFDIYALLAGGVVIFTVYLMISTPERREKRRATNQWLADNDPPSRLDRMDGLDKDGRRAR